MKIKPIIENNAPKYPDKYDEEIKRVLAAARPRRWLETPMIGMLSATIALGLGGSAAKPGVFRANAEPSGLEASENPGSSETAPCVTETNNNECTNEPTPIPADEDSEIIEFIPVPIIDHITMGYVVTVSEPSFELLYPLKYFAIPLFEYGEGRGAVGNESADSPLYLSKEEAYAIISAAFNEAGLELSRGGAELSEASVPVTSLYLQDKEGTYSTQRGNLSTTGFLEDYGLSVVFVSREDAIGWWNNEGSYSVVDMKKTARTITETNSGIAAFYDPVTRLVLKLERKDGESEADYYARMIANQGEMLAIARENARAESERLLRLQVEAFIQWLRQNEE